MKNSVTTFPVFRLAVVLCLLAIGISCSDDDDVGSVDTPIVPKVSIVTLSDTRVIDDVLQLDIGSTLKLSATVEPQNSLGQQVDWSSDDTNIAEVDATGLVRGITDGLAAITATSQDDPDLRDTVHVRVARANSILSFGIQGLETVRPTVTDTEVIFEIDFNTEGRALDVARLITVIDHNGASVRSLNGLPPSSTAPTAKIAQDFRGGPVAYTVASANGTEQTYQVSVKTKPGTEFITTWNTTTITVPTNPDFTYNYNIDTDNDGFIDQTSLTGDDALITFGEGRILRISGQFPAIFFNRGSERNKITSLDQWGTVAWESMNAAFDRCEFLQIPAEDVPNLAAVSDMSRMFAGANSADPDVSEWDTSNVTNMESMFSFTNANPNVSGWDIRNVTNMERMFESARNAKPIVSSWKTEKVENMSFMFLRASSADPDVSGWDTRNVTDMSFMFFEATSAKPNVSDWDTRNVTNMSFVFSGATKAEPDVRDWDTSLVTSMNRMFFEAASATPDVSDWDTRNVTDMRDLFGGATKADPDLSQWNISSIRKERFFDGLSGIFNNSGISRENYEKALIRFAEHTTDPNNEGLSLPQNINLVDVPVTFCSDAAAQAKATLEANGWTGISDRGNDCDL